MSDVEDTLDNLYKLLASITGPLSISLATRKVRARQLKEFREKLIQAVVILDEISVNLNK